MKTVLKIVGVSFMLATASACGGAPQAPGPVPVAAPTPQAVAALTILLKPSRVASINTAAESALVAAGYTIVVDPRAQHDAEGQLVATTVDVPTMFQVTVNGVRQRNLRVTVSLSLQSGGRIVDQVTTNFEAKESEIGPDKLGGLVSALNASERVQKFATDRAANAQQAADEQKTQQASAASAWDSVVGDCRAPKDSHSCDSLKSWLATDNQRLSGRGAQPASRDEAQKMRQRHDDAQQIFDTAAPALQTFADSDAWSKAEVPRCQAASTFDDCAAVQSYIARFPAGAHIDDAKSALDIGGRRIAAKAAVTDREAAARDRAAAGRAHQSSCRAKCSDETCIAYTDENKKAACVAQCTAGCS